MASVTLAHIGVHSVRSRSIGVYNLIRPTARQLFICIWRSFTKPLARLWTEDEGQDIAEYAVMLAVILVLVVGTVRLVGSNANNAFSSVASSLQ